uniref:B30.2/SPRY domain-containing protein n=1 Tax=Oncorhynchus kisutch TaxID=8019 RepID=A0A8C7KTB0_ONCKI
YILQCLRGNHCKLLKLLICLFSSEKFEVLGPTDSIVAVAGDDIILPCYLKPNISAEDMTVDWLNLDFLDSRVFRYQNHRIIREDQILFYSGRTSLYEEELWRGNTSLKLTRVQGTDEGRYKCLIQSKSWYDDFTVQVLVKGEIYFHVNCMFLSTVDVTLDPDTAHCKLILSDDGKQVRHGELDQVLSDNGKRFTNWSCVLGNVGFSGKFYYEVKVEGKTEWTLGVVIQSINRNERSRPIPYNGYWTVELKDGEYTAHADSPVTFTPREEPQKVGVFVDYEKRQVSFYNVEDRSHIYSFTDCSFTEKLYPFFNPGDSDKTTENHSGWCRHTTENNHPRNTRKHNRLPKYGSQSGTTIDSCL